MPVRLSSVLLDTHAWVWSFAYEKQLSDLARETLANANAVHVSPISFFEIGQKVRVGKWPEMRPYLSKLKDILYEQGGLIAPFSPEICLHASDREWSHRDPFDRLIASTAELEGMVLISKDPAFRTLDTADVRW